MLDKFIKSISVNYGKDELLNFSFKTGKQMINRPFPFCKIKEIIEKYRDNADVYMTFCPLAGGQRKLEYALPTRIIAADIDEAKIPEDFEPSYYWETSPGKKQGIWIIDNELTTEEYEQIAKAMSIMYDFDSANDIVHLYRLPLTKNHKYKQHFDISKPIGDGRIYRKKKVIEKFKNVKIKKKKKIKKHKIKRINYDINELLDKYNAKSRFNKDITDRSEYVFALASQMFENGAKTSEVKAVLEASPQDKWSGAELDNQIFEIKAKTTALPKTLPIKGKQSKKSSNDIVIKKIEDIDIDGNESEWLIEDFWEDSSVGMVVAPPKTFKSTLINNFAISVASGTPFCGKNVKQGGVMILQGENTLQNERRRLQKIYKDAYKLPIYYVETQLTLDNIELVKNAIIDNNVKMLVIDPLYILFGVGDINSQKDVTSKLTKLTKLKKETGVSIMVVHHTKKVDSEHKMSANDIYGSAFFNGWYESMIMLEPVAKERNILIHTSFRNFIPSKYNARINDNLSFDIEEIKEESSDDKKELSLPSKPQNKISLVSGNDNIYYKVGNALSRTSKTGYIEKKKTYYICNCFYSKLIGLFVIQYNKRFYIDLIGANIDAVSSVVNMINKTKAYSDNSVLIKEYLDKFDFKIHSLRKIKTNDIELYQSFSNNAFSKIVNEFKNAYILEFEKLNFKKDEKTIDALIKKAFKNNTDIFKQNVFERISDYAERKLAK